MFFLTTGPHWGEFLPKMDEVGGLLCLLVLCVERAPRGFAILLQVD